jgi:hypothetical protein
MQKAFIGLLVGIGVIMFALPLMAADLPGGMDGSTLQALSDSQLNQVRGLGPAGLPPGLASQAHASDGLTRANENLSNGNAQQARVNSRVFSNYGGGGGEPAEVRTSALQTRAMERIQTSYASSPVGALERTQARLQSISK